MTTHDQHPDSNNSFSPSLQTSLLAYESVKVSLGLRQKMVFDVILARWPVSNRDISVLTGLSINQITPRVLELRQHGLVEFNSYAMDPISKKSVCTWKPAERGMKHGGFK